MTYRMGKREFLAAGLALGAGAAFAQTKPGPGKAGVDDLGRSANMPGPKHDIPRRKAKTTKLFLTPPGWPNAITVDPARGFWVQEQRHDNKPEAAWLLDWNGKLLSTVVTQCKDTSGMAFGDGCIWSGANGASEKVHPTPPINGIFQTDMHGKQISHRQIPFGPANDGGACHGLAWQDGKLWISANRLEALVRLDAKTWQVDYMFPHTDLADLKDRIHGIEYDPKGFIWQVAGHQKPDMPGYEGYTPALVKYDIATGKVVEIVDFVPGSCDIHDVALRDGVLYGVDAGEHPAWPIDNPAYQHPGWPALNSPSGGAVFRIDVI